jgi:hypothetical protein
VSSTNGAVCARTTPTCCHSEAGFIGEESACCQPVQQQIPRAAKPRFGMTNPLEISNCATTHSRNSVPLQYAFITLCVFH